MIVAAEVARPSTDRPDPWLKLTLGQPDPAAAALSACIGTGASAKAEPPERYRSRCTSLTGWAITLSANAWISLLLGRITHAKFVRIIGVSLFDLFAQWADGCQLAEVTFQALRDWDDDMLTFRLDRNDPSSSITRLR